MNNQYIQYPLKWSLKPPESISAFRSLVGNIKRVPTMFWFCTNCTKVVWLKDTLVSFPEADLMSPNAQAFYATLSRQLERPEVCKSLPIFTPPSQHTQKEILVEKREDYRVCSFWKIVPVSRGSYNTSKAKKICQQQKQNIT